MITIDENADVDKLQGIVKKYNYMFRSSSTYPSRNNLAFDLTTYSAKKKFKTNSWSFINIFIMNNLEKQLKKKV